MYNILENEHGITAEQAFGIYDMKDTGECSTDEFKRILRIFFGEVLASSEDVDFIMKLTNKRADQRLAYREFCKFLSKRVVRTFKSQGASADGPTTA
jgi:Ca2+-binding EF-hand superfamily protein